MVRQELDYYARSSIVICKDVDCHSQQYFNIIFIFAGFVTIL